MTQIRYAGSLGTQKIQFRFNLKNVQWFQNLPKLHIGEVGGMLDRSPCGSGTAAIVTSNWYRGDFKIGIYKLLNLYLVDYQYLFAHTHHI